MEYGWWNHGEQRRLIYKAEADIRYTQFDYGIFFAGEVTPALHNNEPWYHENSCR
jgi:hypothetical protein